MATTEKVVFITFDDGPHPIITPWVQKELQKFRAKATFFCVGENAQKFPAVLDSLQKDGHKLGNHTHNHLKGWNTADLGYVKNILKAKVYVPSNLFRPPYGRITPRQVSLLKAAGFKIVMWSLLSCDYLKN
ncbi:MAG: polysaccharide deacetylase family protein, partial [Bacteroidia bacterium]|nr:polysaccharide deacetylase family protein [Bacteroidia bacterium]